MAIRWACVPVQASLADAGVEIPAGEPAGAAGDWLKDASPST